MSAPPNERILVAEDDEFMRTLIVTVLTKGGYRVLEAPNGKRALELAIDNKPALVVVDVEMPEMGGLGVIERLRSLGSAIPILVLSGRAAVHDRVHGLTIGADDYLTKPFEHTELLARVKALLRRHERPKEAAKTLCFGDVEVDLERMTAAREGKTVALSRTECSILMLLAGSEGRPVSRERMFDIVWGYTYVPSTRTIDTHIWRLRKKLGDDGKRPRWIKNVPGAGYVLERESAKPEAK